MKKRNGTSGCCAIRLDLLPGDSPGPAKAQPVADGCKVAHRSGGRGPAPLRRLSEAVSARPDEVAPVHTGPQTHVQAMRETLLCRSLPGTDPGGNEVLRPLPAAPGWPGFTINTLRRSNYTSILLARTTVFSAIISSPAVSRFLNEEQDRNAGCETTGKRCN